MRVCGAFEPATDFYRWQRDLTGSPRGTLLRSEPLSDTQLVRGAARGWRVLYVSIGHTGREVAVSGLVYVPKGVAPEGGWPVISYAHGTTGITAAAAPSLNPLAELLKHPVLGTASSFLEVGYAVVATDYEGLGTAGPHPYLHGFSLANSQIDAVRAGRKVTTTLSPVWVAMGQSEGGLSTLFTAAYATTMAPELDYRGAVATAPPTEWATLTSSTSDLGRVLIPLILHAASYHDASVDADGWLNEDGRDLLSAWRTSFLQEPGTVLGTFLPLWGKPLLALAPGEKTDMEAVRRLTAAVDYAPLEVPRQRLDRPVMLAEGGNDELCVPGTVVRLAHDLRAKGSEVDYHFYPEAGHLAVPHHAFVDALQFVRRIAPSCQGSQPDISDLVPR